MKKTKKLNARITPIVEEKLREIVRATGSNMSEVIMRAIELYYKQGTREASETPYEIAKRNGIIGCFKGGPSDLSARYKEYLGESLSEKYGMKSPSKK